MNRPGKLQQILPVDEQSAHLVFTSQDNRRCAVYAALRLPKGRGPHPLVVHAPGGGQTVFEADLEFWTKHGFACVAFDWQVGLFDHDPRRKSHWPAGAVLQTEPFTQWHQFILPLAVEAAGVVIDWATSRAGVDKKRIGMTGISWGGYLTWAVNAYEPRLKAALPVYGCGGLFERAHTYPAAIAKRWAAEYDALALARRQLSPVCWLSSTNDFFGWPRHADRIFPRLRQPWRRSHQPNLDHALTPADVATGVAWMKHYLAGGPPLSERVVRAEQWWTDTVADDPHRCWSPGKPPAWAVAKLTRYYYDDGTAATSAIRELKPTGKPPRNGNVWPDLRAGLGCWTMGGMCMHNNSGRITALPDSTRVRINGKNVAVVLYQRLHGPVRLRVMTPARELTALIQSRRGEKRLRVPVVNHTVRLDLPRDLHRVWLDGFPTEEFEVGPLERCR